MTDKLLNIELLQENVDPEDISEFRILVDHKFIKYISIDAGLYNCDDMCFGPSLIPLFPTLPPGSWNQGHVSRNSTTGQPHFATVSKTEFPGITNTWHPTQIDHLEMCMKQKLCSNVYEATCPHFNSTVIVKFARFPWEVAQLDAETTAYRWIEGHKVGPDFLGHLTEEGRVIGFIIAHIIDCRHATSEDFSLCQTALSKLHKLRIKHGDINKHNFLIHNGKAILIDFDMTVRSASSDELREEMSQLKGKLMDTSGKGGRLIG